MPCKESPPIMARTCEYSTVFCILIKLTSSYTVPEVLYPNSELKRAEDRAEDPCLKGPAKGPASGEASGRKVKCNPNPHAVNTNEDDSNVPRSETHLKVYGRKRNGIVVESGRRQVRGAFLFLEARWTAAQFRNELEFLSSRENGTR